MYILLFLLFISVFTYYNYEFKLLRTIFLLGYEIKM